MKYFPDYFYDNAWIGLYDIEFNGEFKWVDQSVVTYTNFDSRWGKCIAFTV